MWQYKTGYFNSSEKELDDKLNSWGREGWEVFSLVESKQTNEITSNGDSIFRYRIMMKKYVSDDSECIIHSIDLNGKCFKCGEQIYELHKS